MRVGRMARICASAPAPDRFAPGARRSASGMTLVTPEARFAKKKDRQRAQIDFAGRELEAVDERAVLREQEPVRADGGLGLARRPARERDDRRRVRIAGLDARGRIRDAARNRRGARHTAADRRLDGNGANRRGRQAKPVSPRARRRTRRGGTRATQRLSRSRPADGSTNTAVTRSRNNAIIVV